MTRLQAVRVAAGLADDEDSLKRVDGALGESLVAVVQRYLARVSSEWDIDLFFETYGRPPRDGSSWAEAVLEGLEFRKDFPEPDRRALVEESIELAVDLLGRGYGLRE